MIPIIWRYLLKVYVKTSLLTFLGFVSILLITRLDEIAEYATLSPEASKLVIFALFQIIYIIPIALPISCLVGSIILFQMLSHNGELTTLRASGLGVRKILFPILFASSLLSVGSFYINSELATQSHLHTKAMQNDFVSLSPLSILKNPHLLKINSTFTQMTPGNDSNHVKNFFFGIYNPSHKRLNLICISDLIFQDGLLKADGVSILSSFDSYNEQSYDHLVIETQEEATSPSHDFSFLVKKRGWCLQNDHLRLGLLRIKVNTLRHELKSLDDPISRRLPLTKLQECYSELSRRFSIALAPLTFTLMGAAFGIHVQRKPSKRGLIAAIFLASLFLICFFTAKNLDSQFALSTTVYFVPHLVIIASCIKKIKNVSQGISS